MDTFGHINYGPDIYDPKGITQKVELINGVVTNELGNWQIFNLPFDDTEIAMLKFKVDTNGLLRFITAHSISPEQATRFWI